MSACVTYKTHITPLLTIITQVTLKTINNTLLIYNWWLCFLHIHDGRLPCRAFPPAKLLNSILGSQRKTLYFKWSKTMEHLNWSKIFFVLLPLQRYFWLFWKLRWRKWHLFLVTTLNTWKAVLKTVQTFLSQWKPHHNRIKWRRVTGNVLSFIFA